MLEAGCGSEPCKRAGVDPQTLLAKARAATEQLAGNASSLSYLDSELLATMGRAEALMRELGREAVDIQCMYVALGARKHVPAMIGLGTWSDSERTGNTGVVQQASGSASAPLAVALKEDSKVLSELAQEIAAACGAPQPPMEVSVTLQRIMSILAPPGAPVYLRVEFDNARRMTAQREGVDTRFVIVEWAPPAGIALVIREGLERSSTQFTLAASNRWMSGEDELFGTLRKAILGFYPEATKPSGTLAPSVEGDSGPSKSLSAPLAMPSPPVGAAVESDGAVDGLGGRKLGNGELVDRSFKAKQTAPPPPSPTVSTPPPSVPARAKIESYEVADAVGLLKLENGEQLRFGRSACKGFEPVVEASVIVEEVTSYPRGSRAKTVSLDPADGQYDSLLSARDKEMGLPTRTMGSAEAAATARQLALITVLLREPLPEGTLALRKWAAERGFPRDGIDVKTERDLEFSIVGGSVLTYAGRSSLPKDALDTRNLPANFDYGCSFIGLGTGLPGVDRQMRLMRAGAIRDCWAMDGNLRHLSRLVRVLADRATGVVIHRAGELVVPAAEFVRMLGDLEDPECRPFAAWLDVGISDRNGEKIYATFGMEAFGLPDVFVPVNAEDRWSRSRRHEAVLYACSRMVRENRELSAGESLRVPLRTKSGAWPDELDGKTAAFTYSIVEDGSSLKLVPGDEIDLAVQWRDQGDAIAVNAYQALFDRGLADAIPSSKRSAFPLGM